MVSFGVREQRVQCLCRGFPAEGFARTSVERSCNSFKSPIAFERKARELS